MKIKIFVMRVLFVFILLFLAIGMLSLAAPSPAYASGPYKLPLAWQIVYLNTDGSLDVYDYREYYFDGGPPSAIFPYHLGTDYDLYNRTLSYPLFEAYASDVSLSDIPPTDIKQAMARIKSHLHKLDILGTEPDFDISVPMDDHLYLLVHYKVSPDITVVGKDFARTYYQLPKLGKSEVSVDHYYTAFILPKKPTCDKNLPKYDENDSVCPCFMVHRFLPKGGPIGTYHKGCEFVLFEVKNLDVRTVQELDSVYPKTILSAEAQKALYVDQTYKDVKNWQEAHSTSPDTAMKMTWYSLLAAIVAGILGKWASSRKEKEHARYYWRKVEETPAGMDMPSDNVYRSFFFTEEDLVSAMAGDNPYDYTLDITDTTLPSDITALMRKSGNLFRAIFFSLMTKGYISPITDGDKLIGFRIEEGTLPLDEGEKLVFEVAKEAAKMEVAKEKKVGLLGRLFGKGKEEDLAHVMNEREPDKILLPEEFEAYLSKGTKTIELMSDTTVEIPRVAEIGARLIKMLLEKEDLPPATTEEPPLDAPSSIKMWDKISKFFKVAAAGLIMTAGLYFFIAVSYYSFINAFPHPTLLNTAPLALAGLFMALGLMLKGSLPRTWVHPQWFDEFLSWYRVQKWISEFTRIATKDISAYETLNWDIYYIFATLRGMEELLIKALKTTGIIKKTEHIQRLYMYHRASYYMYSSAWLHSTNTFTKEYESQYYKAYRSGSSSSGSFTGSSFGGGGGGGGGSTGW